MRLVVCKPGCFIVLLFCSESGRGTILFVAVMYEETYPDVQRMELTYPLRRQSVLLIPD